MSLYLGENLISGQAILVGESRNIGQIIPSAIPLTDAGLHLLDGSLIDGSGIYSAFVDYIGDLYTADPTASYFAQADGLPWTQPVLTANGTLGGDSFAVSGGGYYSTYAYQAFDNNSSTDAEMTTQSGYSPDLIFYNPDALNVSSIELAQKVIADTPYIKNGTVYGSNNGSDWTQITTFVGTNTASYTIDLSSNSNFYKYYRITMTDSYYLYSGNYYWYVVQCNITAYTQAASPEEWWQNQVLNYGVCGKFVYDSTNNTVRLPKVTGIIEGTTDVNALGDLVEAGLPNITGRSGNGGDRSYFADKIDGCFYQPDSTASVYRYYDQATQAPVTFDASLSNSIYGNSNTVQPQTIKAFYYIVVATSTKTDIQVDIDNIATDLNGKVNISDLAQCHVVVETYQNGTSWYRVYDDGWCEQGGQVSGSPGTKNITFLKPYANISYNILTGGIGYSSSTYIYDGSITNKTANGFDYYAYYAYGEYWQASGYMAAGA